jgi:putative hemolysin
VPTAAYGCSAPDAAASSPAIDTEDASVSGAAAQPVKVPKLLKTYLAIGCRIGGPPAWDREFGTIDFLTFLDLKLVSSSARNRFLAPLTQ